MLNPHGDPTMFWRYESGWPVDLVSKKGRAGVVRRTTEINAPIPGVAEDAPACVLALGGRGWVGGSGGAVDVREGLAVAGGIFVAGAGVELSGCGSDEKD
jgi:hypothetical protein